MDNPGFGEAKEHVTQLADASMISSSAYIYLMQWENIGGKEAAEFFKELAASDKGLLQNFGYFIISRVLTLYLLQIPMVSYVGLSVHVNI